MAKVRIIARFVSNPGKENDLHQLLRSLIAPSYAEKGCEYYELFKSDTLGRFYFNELWSSMEDLQAHGSSDGFKRFVQQVEPLIASPFEVNLLTPIE